jgi:hypothetical protein
MVVAAGDVAGKYEFQPDNLGWVSTLAGRCKTLSEITSRVAKKALPSEVHSKVLQSPLGQRVCWVGKEGINSN